MDRNELAAAFNSWMREYLENRVEGDKFFCAQIRQFEEDVKAGRIPAYGMESVEELERYAAKTPIGIPDR